MRPSSVYSRLALLTHAPALLALTVFAAGCADEPLSVEEGPPEAAADQEREERVTAEPTAEPTEAAEDELPGAVIAYFEALASQSPRQMESMLEVAAEGSPAYSYAGVQYGAAFVSRESAGFELEPLLVDVSDGKVEACDAYGEEPECTEFTKFVVKENQLVAFAIDDAPIEEQTGTPQTIEQMGVTFDVLGSYESVIHGNLRVVIDITGADEPRNLAFSAVEYVDPDNRLRSVRVEGYTGNPMRPNVTQMVLFMVDDASIGGDIILNISDEFSQRIEDVAIPTN